MAHELPSPGDTQALATDEPFWESFRAQMPVAKSWSYLDHAAVAPISGPAHAAIIEWADDLAHQGDVEWNSWAARYEAIRRQAATLLGASQDEIALVRNTTEGVTLVSEGYPWQAGDNVVVPALEFPSNLYPWLVLERRGVEVRRVAPVDGKLDLNRVHAACDRHTRIVAASWVDYATGWRTDLASLSEIAHRQGALCFVDAIQGLGVFPLDVVATGVDFLAADGHKWLLGPEGAGIAFIRREHLERLRPFGLGWHSVKHCGQFDNPALDLRDSAARFEGGTWPMAGFMGLSASLRLLMDVGIDRIAARVLHLAARAREFLAAAGAQIASPADPHGQSDIISFTLPGVDPHSARRACRDAGVALSCRAGRLRISPHGYNNEDDLRRLVELIGTLSRH